MERREFLRASCSLCMILGSGLVMSELSSCSSLPIYKTVMSNNTVAVPLSLFVENDFHIIRPNNFEYDIALRRLDDGSYTAILLRCTHADNQLTYTGSEYFCSVHGSAFDTLGTVRHGPAQRPLQKLQTQISNNDILISIPK